MNTGDHLTWAQAAGEEPISTAFAVGVDFDPSDREEVEIVGEATAGHLQERVSELERRNEGLMRENSRLSTQVAELTGADEAEI